MAEPLNRPLANHRLLREVSGPDLTVSLGTGLRAVYETPTMGELAAKSWELGNTTDAFTEEEKNRVREAEFERQRRIRALEANVEFLQDGQERDDALAEIQALQSEKQTQINALTQDAIEQGRLQPPEALTEEYGELGLTFDRPMTNEQARILADNKRAEIIRNALIEKSPQGLGAGLLKFGAGLAAMATDPLEVATTFIPVAGPALKARAVSRLGQVGGRVAIGATEGAVGQALVEPIYYGLSKQQQLDYTMADALTNVGFGLLFGGGVGAVAGVLGRRAQRARGDIDAPDLPSEFLEPSLQKEVAETSFRQFMTDQTVDISSFLDGRDLRSSTTISRVGGIEFQSRPEFPVNVARDIRPRFLQTDEAGNVVTFNTAQKADFAAQSNGGTVVALGDGFAIRRTSEGDFVRTPTGNVLEFGNQRQAEKFLKSARDIPEQAKIVNLGPGRFAISRDIPDADIRSIEKNLGTTEIPRGINTREVSVLPNADALLGDAVRGVVAKKQVASELAARSADVASDPYADVGAAQRATEISKGNADLQSSAREDIDYLQRIVDQIENDGQLDDLSRAEIAELNQIDEKARAYREVAEAAAVCLTRS